MIYKNFNIHFIFIILSVLSQLLNTVVYGQDYKPETRVGHAAVSVEDKIYHIGGFRTSNKSDVYDLISDFFYLDANTDSENFLTWVDLKKDGVNLPYTVWHIANIGGVNQDSIFIVGGAHYNVSNICYEFDTKTNALSIPAIQGIVPPSRKGINSVSLEGKIYMFGGQTGGADNITLFSNFDILDTINLNWKVGSLINSPGIRTLYTATLVNGIIYYIGGKSGSYIYSPMTDIYLYDIIGDTWSLKTATAENINTMPGPREGHSAVLNDGKIFIYGGLFSSNDLPYKVSAKETIATLDTITFVWSIPALNDTNVPKLAYHTATLMYKFMIITFGNVTDMPLSEDQTNKSPYMFNLADPNFQWFPLRTSIPIISITTNPPLTPPDAKTEPQQSSTSNKMIIVGISVASVILILSIYVTYSLFNKHKKNPIEAEESGGNANNNISNNEVKSEHQRD
ncbi:hypothetical protein C1645_831525 [Glomus cerebriforme]|uniref:Galactose oxidase n=1 Tax=Glomus cerebriforme TaxID=658196 RepID=A0A397SFB7_9GLOM|nr:hypothetical protein C1645_831525 [Glomus cerebriforme]